MNEVVVQDRKLREKLQWLITVLVDQLTICVGREGRKALCICTCRAALRPLVAIVNVGNAQER